MVKFRLVSFEMTCYNLDYGDKCESYGHYLKIDRHPKAQLWVRYNQSRPNLAIGRSRNLLIPTWRPRVPQFPTKASPVIVVPSYLVATHHGSISDVYPILDILGREEYKYSSSSLGQKGRISQDSFSID